MTRLLTHNGQTDTIAGWAATNGITKSAIYQRLDRGWTADEVCANKRIHRSAHKVKTSTPVNLPLEELNRRNLVLRREVTRVLRQFARDLEAIMSRGVVRDFSRWPVDRSIPVARHLSETGNS